MKKIFKLDFDGRELVVETGELAKQTNGAVLVRLEIQQYYLFV